MESKRTELSKQCDVFEEILKRLDMKGQLYIKAKYPTSSNYSEELMLEPDGRWFDELKETIETIYKEKLKEMIKFATVKI